MYRTGLHWLGRSAVAVAAVTLSTGCVDDSPVAPGTPSTLAAPAPARERVFLMAASSGKLARGADLTGCERLQVPAGNTLALRTYANGVQIYRWNGTSWSFVAPAAVLTADAEGKSTVGSHYGGPTWESNSGGKVVGAVIDRCTPEAGSIPWLLLGATPTEGPGVFHRVTFIQRVNTAGGNAPSTPGSFTGEEARVPYTTEYLFYRAQ